MGFTSSWTAHRRPRIRSDRIEDKANGNALHTADGSAPEAIGFLRNHGQLRDRCPHCNRHSGYMSRIIGTAGMFDDLNLLEYQLDDGRTAKEVIQTEIWSSGPMIWLQLEVSDGTVFSWADDAIQE